MSGIAEELRRQGLEARRLYELAARAGDLAARMAALQLMARISRLKRRAAERAAEQLRTGRAA